MHVDNVEFVWQKQMSEGQLYQAKRAQFVHFIPVTILLFQNVLLVYKTYHLSIDGTKKLLGMEHVCFFTPLVFYMYLAS